MIVQPKVNQKFAGLSQKQGSDRIGSPGVTLKYVVQAKVNQKFAGLSQKQGSDRIGSPGVTLKYDRRG